MVARKELPPEGQDLSWVQWAGLPVLVPVPCTLVALGLFPPLVALFLGLEVGLSPHLPEDSDECPRSPGEAFPR